MKKSTFNLKKMTKCFFGMPFVLLFVFIFFTFSAVKSQTATSSQKNFVKEDKQNAVLPSKLQDSRIDNKLSLPEKYGNVQVGYRSVAGRKWQKGGIYEKYAPEQELLDKRTRVAKHFDNGDGSYSAIIGDLQHYQDEYGAWQDIDFTIKENNTGKFNAHGYANITHEIKTFYPDNTTGAGIIMQYGNRQYNVWKNPSLKILNDNKSVVSSVNATACAGIPNDNMIRYNDFPGVTDEFVVLESGIENNIIINALQGSLLAANGGNAAFVQFIPLQAGYTVLNNDAISTTDFECESFTIKVQGDTIGLTFAPIVIFDDGVSMERAYQLLSLPDNKLTPEEMAERDGHVTTGSYMVHFVPGGIEVYSLVSVDWLQNSGRVFPITIDPTLTFGSGMANYDYPWFMKYGYTRSAAIYLYSEIGNIGNVLIKNVGWYVNASSSTVAPSVLRLKTATTTAWDFPSLTWSTATANSSIVETGNYYFPNIGWQVMLLDTVFPYSYSTTANLQVLTECNYGGTGATGTPYFRYTTYSKCRHQWWFQDNTPPTNNGTFGYNRPNLFITYTPGADMCGNWQGSNIVPTTVWQNITCTAGRKPFFAFAASSGTTYNFSTCDSYDGVEDTWIGIYNSSGTLITENDDYGPYCNTSLAASLNWTCPSNGTYYVAVSHYNCTDLVNTGNLKYKYAGVPVNDACANAINLPCGTTNMAGTTENCVSETPGTGCSVSAYGVWYKFTGDGIETTISSTANFDHEMDIVYGSCGNFTSVVCRDQYLSGGTETYTFTPTYGTTYYIYIAYYTTGTTTGTFTISRTCATSPCSNITAINGCGSGYAKTFTGGGAGVWNTGFFDFNSCGFDSPGTEKIYSFVAPTTGTYSIQVTAASGYVDYQWQANTCGETGWTCIDDIYTAGTYGSMNWTQGVTYYILLDDENSTTGTHTFYINCPVIPPNDLCVNATSLPCGTTGLSGTTVNCVSETTVTGCNMSNYGVWYKFTGDGVETTISSAATFDHQMAILSGSCGNLTNVACVDDYFFASTETYTFTPVSGTNYYIYIGHWSSTSTITGTFTISRSCAGSPCSNITAIGCGAGNAQTFTGGGSGFWASNPCYSSPGIEKIYSFVAPVTGVYSIEVTAASGYVDYLWQANTCAESGWTCIDDLNAPGTYGAMNWTQGVTYFLLLDDENSTTGTHTFYVNCPVMCTPPSNETCAGATLISQAQITAGFNTSGTLGCSDDCAGRAYNDVFFRFDCTTTGNYTLDMRNSDGDTYMRIFSGSCCGTLLDEDDDSYDNNSGLAPEIIIPLTAGMSYWIECGTYSDVTGGSAYNLYASMSAGVGHNVSGKTVYAGKANTGNPVPTPPAYSAVKYSIDNVIVSLKSIPGGTEVARDTSDALGMFQFTNVADGNYRLSFDKYSSDTMQWGNGIDAIDVALLKYNIGADTTVDPTRNFSAKYKKAADVDNNLAVNGIDIARIKAKVGSPYSVPRNFPAGNWPTMDTLITVAGADLNLQLKTICNGDYNASSNKYLDSLVTWSLSKSLPENIIVQTEESMIINDNRCFEVPLRISSKINDFSALGLTLNYPHENFKLENVTMPSTGNKNGTIRINPTLEEIFADDNDLLVTDDAGVIRVVFATTHPFDVSANDQIINFRFCSLRDLPQGETGFELNGTGIIGDQYGEENEEAYLLMPKIFVQGDHADPEFRFAGYPNPFSGDATLTYSIPEAGAVKLNVYNSIGELVTELVNENRNSGEHTVVFSPKDLSAGMYTFKLEYAGLNKSKCLVLKLIH
ncbi:MAG TPA: T9SS type A sorting domain-containing protein [Bacteroidales bacterium]|nr:T9SS type A sorting domain-containing protein [Bacteroidales bacterium]